MEQVEKQGIRCSRFSCVHHRFRKEGNNEIPGRCTIRKEVHPKGKPQDPTTCTMADDLGGKNGA